MLKNIDLSSNNKTDDENVKVFKNILETKGFLYILELKNGLHTGKY